MNTPSPYSMYPHKEYDRAEQSCGALSGLPDELLGEISHHVMRMMTDRIDLYNWPENPYDCHYSWISVSQVCCRWRQVALTTPRLWATIMLPCNASWLCIMIQRSGQLPLTIIAASLNQEPENQLQTYKDLITGMVPRTKNLQLNLNTPFSRDILSAFALPGARASLLEALNIKVRIHESVGQDDIGPVLIDGPLPYLRHLTYQSDTRRVRPWPDLPILKQLLFPSLTGLHLHYLETPISVESCLEILATLPNLEDLILGKAVSSRWDVHAEAPPPSRLVHLPHIRKIAFQGNSEWYLHENDDGDHGMGQAVYSSCSHAADVLQHLAVPSSADILFTAGEEFLVGRTLKFICGVLREAIIRKETNTLGLPRLIATHCRILLRVQKRFTGECVVELFNTAEDTEDSKLRKTLIEERPSGVRASRRSLRSQFRTHSLCLYECVQSILESFGPAVSAVTSLNFTGYLEDMPFMGEEGSPHHLDAIWLRLQETMPELRHLSLHGRYSADFIRWLVATLESNPSYSESGLGQARLSTFPDLQSLGVNFFERAQTDAFFETLGRWSDSDDYDNDYKYDNGGTYELENTDICEQLISALRLWSAQFEDKRKLQELTITAPNPFSVREGFGKIETSGVVQSVEIRDIDTEPTSDQGFSEMY